MYRVVRASILYYEKYMRGTNSRYNLIKPFMLLTSVSEFNIAKENKTDDYLNLCDIIYKMNDLALRDEDKYHHIKMLLSELHILGFNVCSTESAYVSSDELIREQIDLLLQFFAFRYPFDEFDNKTGVHDINSNKFIFIQP
jgi:hypothetical protein